MSDLKKEISSACGGVRALGKPLRRAQAPLGSPSARVSRAGEIISVKKFGPLGPSFLSQLQDDFQAYILEDDPRMDDQVVGTKKASAEERLEIYANAYRFRLLDILIDDYSKLASLLGDEQFHELANDYIDAHPSKFFSVRCFGQHMSEFLQNTDPYLQQPILAEIAKFEWGLMNSFDAPDNTLISMDDLANIPPNDWANICFTFTASLQRLDLQWNVVETWKALDAEQTPPSPKKSEFPQSWMLWRKDLDPHFRSLPVEEASAMDAAITGKSFGDICEGMCEWLDEQHVPDHAATLLKGWIAEGVVTDMTSCVGYSMSFDKNVRTISEHINNV